MADERGSVVVRERSQQAKGPGSILGWKFLLFNKKDSLYQLKNFLSVLKMATTVYETETCDGDGNENVSSKYYFPIFNLFCDYLNLFNMENAQELFRV